MARIVVVGSLAKSLILFRGDLLRELQGLGHQVLACAPDFDQDTEKALTEIEVKYCRIALSRTGLNPLSDLVYTWKLFRFFRQEKIDLFLGYTIKPVIYGSLAARLAGVTTRAAMITGLGYAFSGTSLARRCLNALVRWLYRISLSGAKVIIFQNPDDCQTFERLSLRRGLTNSVVVNGSGVDLVKFCHSPNNKDQTSTKHFLLIARLLAEKGIREYVEAARIIHKSDANCQFHLVGWIDQNPNSITKQELASWIEDKIVVYHGAVDDVRPLIADCNVYVLPSYYPEGTPRTILEAMAMGKAIITTDTPGCKETVENGVNGFLIQPRSVDQLIIAIRKFLTDPTLATTMGKQSRLIAEQRYDVHKVNAAIVEALGLRA